MQNAKTKPGRRNFLLAVGAGGVAATAAVASKISSSQKAAGSQDEKSGKGYQDTAHIRNYYRTTQV